MCAACVSRYVRCPRGRQRGKRTLQMCRVRRVRRVRPCALPSAGGAYPPPMMMWLMGMLRARRRGARREAVSCSGLTGDKPGKTAAWRRTTRASRRSR
jgi:hypothetical protein